MPSPDAGGALHSSFAQLAVGARDSSRSSAPTLNKGGGNARHGSGARSRGKGSGRNTASFDPESTYTRPDARIVVASPCHVKCPRTLSHDDIICVPELLCAEDDYKTYHKLLEELQGTKTEWTSWHEGCHLITKTPQSSPTFQAIVRRLSEYFGVHAKQQGTRFNWYKDAKDWKPFHYDSAAFNAQRAKQQNITVGASFGAERELSFLHVSHGTTLSFPQQNGMAFSFGRDVNLRFQHGIRALPPEKQANIKGAVEAKGGRISIVLWGWVTAEDEHDENSPPMLTDETRGGSGNAQAHRGGNRGRGGARGSSDSSPKSPATPPQ